MSKHKFRICPICSNNDPKLVHFVARRENLNRIMCAKCGLIYFDDRIPELPKYDINYNRGFFRPGDLQKAGMIAGTIAEILGSPKKHPLCLEVGPGNGLTSYLLKALNYRFEAIEIEQDQAQFITQKYKTKCYIGKFETFMHSSTYSFIYAGHVIEHSETPLKFFAKAWEILEPNGLFFFDTPDTHYMGFSGGTWKHFNTRQSYEHCSLFNLNTIDHVARRIGFKIKTIESSMKYESMQILLRKV